MRIEILCTGDEILTGKTPNTNFGHIARRLGEVGLEMYWSTVVGDDRQSLLEAFQLAAKRADAVIVNGGLGPTVDDLSQEIAAEAAGVDLVLDNRWLTRMEDFYERRGRTMPPNNRKQAMLPEGAEFIDNPIGTACGFAVSISGSRFFFTPGVPREMRRMIDEQVIPRLLKLSGITMINRLKRFHSFGIGESRADQLLHGIESMVPGGGVKLGFQAHYPQLETKLLALGKTKGELNAKMAPVEKMIRDRLGNFIVSEDEQTLEGVTIEALNQQHATLAIAEMFTSGAISSRFIPKSENRDPIVRSIIARKLEQIYNTVGLETKGLSTEIDANTSELIAEALRKQSGSSHGLAVLIKLDQGKDKLEFGGTIDIGIADQTGTISREARLLGGRDWVRLGAVELAIDCMRRHLLGLPIDERIDFEQRKE